MMDIHFSDERRFVDFCPTCEFLFSVRIFKNMREYRDIDIYKSCDGGIEDKLEYTPFAFVFSDKANSEGDYSSGMNIRMLLERYIKWCFDKNVFTFNEEHTKERKI